jgi:hypothetical protein
MSLSPTEPLSNSNILETPLSTNNILAMNQENENKITAEKGKTYHENSENLMSSNSKNSSKTKLNVKIRAWNGVATWKWIANDDTCGICRVAFDGCCPGNYINIIGHLAQIKTHISAKR